MSQAHSLRHMLRTRTPYQRKLERLLDCPVDLIANVLDCASSSHDQRLAEVRVIAPLLRVDAHQLQFLPAPIDNILETEVQLTRHDDGMRLACQLVQVRQTDGIDLIIDVQALDVLAMVDVDDVDEVVNCGVLVADQHFGVEDLVVLQHLVDHLFVKTAFGRRLEVDLHSAGLLGLQVDVSLDVSVVKYAGLVLGSLRWVLV